MAELPKVFKTAISGCHDFAANSNKTESKSALRQLFYLLYTYAGIKINPKEYIIKFILLGFLISGFSSYAICVNSSVTSPNQASYNDQWIPINGTASEDTAKVEVQIYQHESYTYWDGKCWVGTSHWLPCEGTTSWVYDMSTYFSENLTYTIRSRATDKSGNVETSSNDIQFVIDKKPPTSYITFPENGKSYDNIEKIYGNAQDWGSGVAFVRIRLKDLSDGTYWDGNEWNTNEVWVKAYGAATFSLTTSVWKVGHQYNVTAQAVDFGGIEQGVNTGYNFGINSALKLSVKTLKPKYGYGEPIDIEICFENTAKSTHVVEFPSSKIYDFTIDSIYKYSDNKTFTPSKTFISFSPGKTTYTETVTKLLPAVAHLVTVESEYIATEKLTAKAGFEVVWDVTPPCVTHQSGNVELFRYFSIPVTAKITDNSEISNATIYSGNYAWQMTKVTGDIWSGSIPAEYNTSSSLSYYIEAVDLSGNKTKTGVITITLKDIPVPEIEEISVTPTEEDNTYTIGITNYPDLNEVYYRVYYDKGTGTIDYSSPVGTIDSEHTSVTTPKLNPESEYKFTVVPVVPAMEEPENPEEETESEETSGITNIPAPVIFVQTYSAGSSSNTIESTGNTITTIKIPTEVIVSDPKISVTQPDINITEKIIPLKPVNSICVSKPKTISSEKYTPSTPTPQKLPITIEYNDKNNDGYLDGTSIKETTLVILKYNEAEEKWEGGFVTIVNTEQNFCAAYVDRIGTYAVFSALQIYPAGVENLKGTCTEKFEAKIEWTPSPSTTSEQYNIYYQNEFYREKNYSARYRIYWDAGTGTINYSKAIADVNPGASASSWTSHVLDTGLYKFAVRVIDIEGTEEKNTNYVVVRVNKKGEASASIRIPKDGKRLKGNAVTVIADATANSTAVQFQYKQISSADNMIMPFNGKIKVTLLKASASLISDIFICAPDKQLLIKNNLLNVGTLVETEYPAGTELNFFIRTYANSWGLGTYDHYSNSKYCKINIEDSGSWKLYFEDLPDQQADWDYNDVVLLVEIISTGEIKEVDNPWINISSLDKKPPYAVYWDISKLQNGEYKLRAVAYDCMKLADPDPREITVYVDDVNWDISEEGNPDLNPDINHVKQQKITGTGDVEIFTADGTGAVVPEGTIQEGTILNISEIESMQIPCINSSIQSIGVFREYEFSNGKTKFEKSVIIHLPYPDENDDGIVDGTDIRVEDLEIYYLDEDKNEWKKADNRSGLGDGTNPGQGSGRDNSANNGTDNPNNKNKKSSISLSSQLIKTITANVSHFTKFGIFAKTAKLNLDNVFIYPNPFKPSTGHTYITFDGLTSNVKIKIYTIAGRLVDEFETTTDGSYHWIPDIASGVYIYYIEDEDGKGTTKGKIGIIR
ncbi:MAG: T9SS type A sorting domain-containing protein [Elusimicrobia bacterium]|nr:T9SS type A sorting domain-containing protein [Elusimicrobiota bacterium]